MITMSGRWPAAARRRSSSLSRSSPLMLFNMRTGPSPGAKARVKASIRPSGFFRSMMLKKSKMNRNVKRSGTPSRSRERRPSSEAPRWEGES